MAIVKIKGMSCQHCVASTTKALKALPGISDVEVDLGKGEARFEGNIDLQEVKNRVFQPLDGSNFIYDVDVSGAINVVDLQETKNNLFTSASCD